MDAIRMVILQNGADPTVGGIRGNSESNRALCDAAYVAQDGKCYLCGIELNGDADLDRLIPGERLHAEAHATLSPQCIKAKRCRCGYQPGNVAAAHRVCNNAHKDTLTNAELMTLISRYAPTAEAMAQAKPYASGRVRREQRAALLAMRERATATRVAL